MTWVSTRSVRSGIHLDHDIGSLDLKFSGAADVGSQEGRLFSDGVVVALVEIFQILFRRATLLEELFHLVFVQSQGLGLIGMLVHHLCDLFHGMVFTAS